MLLEVGSVGKIGGRRRPQCTKAGSSEGASDSPERSPRFLVRCLTGRDLGYIVLRGQAVALWETGDSESGFAGTLIFAESERGGE